MDQLRCLRHELESARAEFIEADSVASEFSPDDNCYDAISARNEWWRARIKTFQSWQKIEERLCA
jgi:hypothetical protein